MVVGVQSTAPAALPLETNPVPIVQEAGWAQGLVWTGAENLASTGFRSPYRSARSESLYRLSYIGPRFRWFPVFFFWVSGDPRGIKPLVLIKRWKFLDWLKN